ncbi:hypothetical protein [Nocardia sp. Marseille-Q1738]
MSDALSNGSSEIAALAQQVETARGKLPLQYDPALLEVLSEREIAAERELAEWIRGQRRQQRRREIEAELAAEQRDRKSAAALRRADEADARWHRRALAARRRVSSEDARLAQLYRRAEWSSRALIAVVVLGMVWAGVNVQHNLVPSGDMSDPLYWLSYGIEAMISIPIITIMVAATTAARWGRELARGKVIFFEAALLGTTVALNTGPHLAAGDLGRAAEYAIAPVMVGVVIWLHAWVSARYAVLIDGAPVVDRDAPMIRIDAEHVSGRSDYHPLDNRDDPANGGRFRRDAGSAAPRLSGAGANSGSMWADRPESGHHSGNDAAPFTGTGVERDESAASTAAKRTAATPTDHAKPSPTNGHITDSRTNGHSVDNHHAESAAPLAINHADGDVSETSAASPRTDGPWLTGHTVPPRANGHGFPHATNGHTVETSTNGPAHNLVNGHTTATTTGRTADIGNADPYPDGEVRDISTASGRADAPSTDGHPVAAPNGRVFPQATNGHRVETSSHGYARDIPVNGHPTPPNTTSNGHTLAANGHAILPATNGYTGETSSTNGYAHDLGVDGYAGPTTDRPTAENGSPAPSVVAGHSAAPLPEDRPASSIAPPANARTTQSADDPAALPYSADADGSSPAVESSSATVVNHPEASIAGTLEPHRETRKPPAAQQISMEDLHGDFVLRSGAPSNDTTANSPVAQSLSSSKPAGRPIERGYGGFDSTGTTAPTRTPTAATADAAAQANPKATAPRAAKRGKSLSAEHGDRSSDAESEQLALGESPEPVRPHLRAEPMPILDEDDEDDDEFSTETDEADTDDDEISAIARAITGRRLSNLPIEEVREILTLADQGGTTPAIANELGVSRAAVTRVLDSAIRVHRPYLVIG